MDQDFRTEEVFESAVSIVRNLPKEGPIKPSDEFKLKLYAYYKQATHGPNDTAKPRFYQIVEAYKWDAWRKLGEMSKEEAMLNYIRELKQVMESIPSEEADPESNKHFEDVLGKKFYDYWFQQWRLSGRTEQLATGDIQEERVSNQDQKMLKNHDTQSISSRGSSMSMLDETQSACDGYKTPNGHITKETFAGDVSDQVASAILRLQHNLDETIIRLNSVESQVKKSMETIRNLESQTYAKQPHLKGDKRRGCLLKPNSPFAFLSSVKAFHWFYLTYPVLVYIAIKAWERRNRNSSR